MPTKTFIHKFMLNLFRVTLLLFVLAALYYKLRYSDGYGSESRQRRVPLKPPEDVPPARTTQVPNHVQNPVKRPSPQVHAYWMQATYSTMEDCKKTTHPISLTVSMQSGTASSLCSPGQPSRCQCKTSASDSRVNRAFAVDSFIFDLPHVKEFGLVLIVPTCGGDMSDDLYISGLGRNITIGQNAHLFQRDMCFKLGMMGLKLECPTQNGCDLGIFSSPSCDEKTRVSIQRASLSAHTLSPTCLELGSAGKARWAPFQTDPSGKVPMWVEKTVEHLRVN